MEIDRQEVAASLTSSTELTKSKTWSTKFDFIPYVFEIVSFLQSFDKASWSLYLAFLSDPCFHLAKL
jgi:hypothetical protein